MMRKQIIHKMRIVSVVSMLLEIVFGLIVCFYSGGRLYEVCFQTEIFLIGFNLFLLGVMDILAFSSLRKKKKGKLSFLWAMVQAIPTLAEAVLILLCFIAFEFLGAFLWVAGYVWIPVTMIAMPLTALGLRKVKFSRWWYLLLWDVLMIMVLLFPWALRDLVRMTYGYHTAAKINPAQILVLIILAVLVLRWTASMALQLASTELKKKSVIGETALSAE